MDLAELRALVTMIDGPGTSAGHPGGLRAVLGVALIAAAWRQAWIVPACLAAILAKSLSSELDTPEGEPATEPGSSSCGRLTQSRPYGGSPAGRSPPSIRRRSRS